MEKVIQMVMIRGEAYINRIDTIALLKEMVKKAESLNAKNDLECVISMLSEGIEDHSNGN